MTPLMIAAPAGPAGTASTGPDTAATESGSGDSFASVLAGQPGAEAGSPAGTGTAGTGPNGSAANGSAANGGAANGGAANGGAANGGAANGGAANGSGKSDTAGRDKAAGADPAAEPSTAAQLLAAQQLGSLSLAITAPPAGAASDAATQLAQPVGTQPIGNQVIGAQSGYPNPAATGTPAAELATAVPATSVPAIAVPAAAVPALASVAVFRPAQPPSAASPPVSMAGQPPSQAGAGLQLDPAATTGSEAPGNAGPTVPAGTSVWGPGRHPVASHDGAPTDGGPPSSRHQAWQGISSVAADSSTVSVRELPAGTAPNAAPGQLPQPPMPHQPIIEPGPVPPGTQPPAGPVRDYPATVQPLPRQLAGPVLELRASGDGSRLLNIALHPAELGPVNLHVRLLGDSMTIQLASMSESAHAAIRDALPQLRHELQSAGLSNVDVSLDLNAGSSGGSAGSGDRAAAEAAGQYPGRLAHTDPVTEVLSRPTTTTSSTRAGDSGLDRWL